MGKIKIFSPYEKAKIFWDFIIILLLLFLIILIPFQYFFQLPQENFNYFILFIMKYAYTFYTCDILISLNCGYYLRGLIIKKRKMILIFYCKNFLLIDILGIIPLLIKNSNIFQFLVLFHIIKLKKLVLKLDEVLLLKDKWRGKNFLYKFKKCTIIFLFFNIK